jgi:hypothetical protein
MLKVQSSRRAAAMKSTDYDHEIAIVDNDGSAAGGTPMERISTESRLLPPGQAEQPPQELSDDASDMRIQERPVEELQQDQQQDQSGVRRPSIEVAGEVPALISLPEGPLVSDPSKVIAATPDAFHNGAANRKQKQPAERETVIDILYENERGGFLCGRPLFSAAALGGLDPTPWSTFGGSYSM